MFHKKSVIRNSYFVKACAHEKKGKLTTVLISSPPPGCIADFTPTKLWTCVSRRKSPRYQTPTWTQPLQGPSVTERETTLRSYPACFELGTCWKCTINICCYYCISSQPKLLIFKHMGVCDGHKVKIHPKHLNKPKSLNAAKSLMIGKTGINCTSPGSKNWDSERDSDASYSWFDIFSVSQPLHWSSMRRQGKTFGWENNRQY